MRTILSVGRFSPLWAADECPAGRDACAVWQAGRLIYLVRVRVVDGPSPMIEGGRFHQARAVAGYAHHPGGGFELPVPRRPSLDLSGHRRGKRQHQPAPGRGPLAANRRAPGPVATRPTVDAAAALRAHARRGKAPRILPAWNLSERWRRAGRRAAGSPRKRRPLASRTARPASSAGSRAMTVRAAKLLVPCVRRFGRVGRVASEVECLELLLRVAGGAGRFLEDARRAEARVLAARGPRQVAQGLDLSIARQGVDEVSRFDPADQREHLGRRRDRRGAA